MEDKVRIISKCWEILYCLEHFDEEKDCFEDLSGEISALTGDILYHLVSSMEGAEISALVNRFTVEK